MIVKSSVENIKLVMGGGAACLIYPDVMKKCADRLESDLLILPSSIHETLLLPDDGMQLPEYLAKGELQVFGYICKRFHF